MKRIMAFSLTMVLSAAAVGTTPLFNSPSLLLAGPLQSYNALTHTAVILGQNVPIGTQRPPQAGLTVSVFGTINTDGSFNVSSISSGNVYVPGVTNIFLTGVVKTSNPMLDLITVGGVTVNLTVALISSRAVMPPVGTMIQLMGTQPVIGGVILAQAINEGALLSVTSANAIALETFLIMCSTNNSNQGGGGITGSGRPGGPH